MDKPPELLYKEKQLCSTYCDSMLQHNLQAPIPTHPLPVSSTYLGSGLLEMFNEELGQLPTGAFVFTQPDFLEVPDTVTRDLRGCVHLTLGRAGVDAGQHLEAASLGHQGVLPDRLRSEDVATHQVGQDGANDAAEKGHQVPGLGSMEGRHQEVMDQSLSDLQEQAFFS